MRGLKLLQCGVLVDFVEDDGDGFAVSVRDLFYVYIFLCQGFCSDVSV